MQTVLYVVGYCPSCETGPLSVRICGGCGTAWVQCEECDALYDSPEIPSPARFPSQPELPCPRCQASLWTPPSHWATYDEMEKLGWQDAIIAQGSPLTRQADPWWTEERPWHDPVDEEPREPQDGPDDPSGSPETR